MKSTPKASEWSSNNRFTTRRPDSFTSTQDLRRLQEHFDEHPQRRSEAQRRVAVTGMRPTFRDFGLRPITISTSWSRAVRKEKSFAVRPRIHPCGSFTG